MEECDLAFQSAYKLGDYSFFHKAELKNSGVIAALPMGYFVSKYLSSKELEIAWS